MADSVFTKIIRGELPSNKVYEDQKTIVIVPLHPIAKGHLLVIPKLQVDHFMDLPDEDYEALFRTVKKAANRLRQVLSPRRVGLQIVGVDVPHAHVHVIAFDSVAQFREVPDESAAPDLQRNAELARLLAF